MKYRLGDICTITKGATGIMKAIPGSYTMIALGETDKTHMEYQFDTKAVIIPLVSSTGHGHASMKRVKYCEGKFALGNILCAVIPNDESFVLAKYLHIYLHWNREELLVSQMKGMANVSLPMNRIADVMVTVPSIDKQRKIIELEKQLVEKELKADNLFADQLTQLENLNQAILQEAVQGKLLKQDLKDEAATELLKRIKAEKAKSGKKEKPLPPIKPEEIPFQIPENWVWCRLGEIIQYTENLDIQKYLSPDTIVNYVDIDAIDNQNFIIREAKQKPVRELSTRARRVLKPNFIAYSTVRPYLKNIAIVEEEKENYIGSTGFNVFKTLNVELKYAFYYLLTPYVNNSFKDLMVGFNSPSITNVQFEKSLLPLPPLSEQKRIVAEIEKQLAKTKQLKEHIIANQQATEQLLKALLHQAFEVEEESENIAEKPNGKIVELTRLQAQEENHFVKRKILATYIINQSLDDSKFGDVKFEKLLHLSDYFALKRNLGQKYYQKAAGPYDNTFTRTYFQQIEKSKWFKRTLKGNQFVFSKAQNHSKSTNTYDYFSDEELKGVDRIISYFKKYDYEQPEIVSTLYAVWNNRIILQKEIKDGLLMEDFYAWDSQKKKYERKRLESALQWMRQENLVPDGWGKVIEKPKSKKKS